MGDSKSDRTLVAGIERTGTTWIAQTFARAERIWYVHEPDNNDHNSFARQATDSMSHLPVVAREAEAPAGYSLLWDVAFAGGLSRLGVAGLAARLLADRSSSPLKLRGRLAYGAARAGLASRRRTARSVLVKSVRVDFSLEWIAARYNTQVLLVFRHPLNVFSSWLQLGYVSHRIDQFQFVRRRFEPVGLWPAPDPALEEHLLWEICVRRILLEDLRGSHPEWVHVEHDDLLLAPVDSLRKLAAQLGYEWNSRMADFVIRSDRPGTGFGTNRVAAELVDAWQGRLSRGLQARGVEMLDRFRSSGFELPR